MTTGSRKARAARPRFFIPEVVQTSNMDCGPAALKAMLEGFGVRVHYGRLREACQTDVDGTSIDTMEEIAGQLGLDAEQIMLPRDHVLIEEAGALPAIAVVLVANRMTHFVVVWRRHGRWVQLMDPGTGRRWTSEERLLGDLYQHRMVVSASGWRVYAGSEDFLRPLRRRMERLGLGAEAGKFIADAMRDPGWRPIASLDAAVRMLDAIIESKSIEPGTQAAAALRNLLEKDDALPEHFWTARPAPPTEAGEEQVQFRGAVLVRVKGRREEAQPELSSPELAAAIRQPAIHPGRELVQLLAEDGVLTPAAMIAAMAVASAAVILEAVLFRSLLDVGRMLDFATLRLGAIAALVLFSAALLGIEIPLASSVLRLGRRLEVRLRWAFLRKIPRLGDRYFQSRLKSDMAERSHSLHLIRRLPELGSQLLRYSFEIVFTTAGIIWLDPASSVLAIFGALAAIGIPLVAQPLWMERDLRVRTHAGALSHFYLDALLGLVPIHTHGAQRAVRREHESLLSEWARAGVNLQRTVISAEAVQYLTGFGLAIWILAAYLGRHGDLGPVLLLVYWALNLPALGQEIAILARQYPTYRNVTLRLLEPLGAIEQAPAQTAADAPTAAFPGPVSLNFERVGVTVSGHAILREIDLHIQPGEHIAIVGPSGAGKSSLVGILLGWFRASAGRVLVNGLELDENMLSILRGHTAWVDPAVQLWNKPLVENLRYGLFPGANAGLDEVVRDADLQRVLDRLPAGFETPLGEGGGLVSGGEGQRVRFARALLRKDVRLAILDEPFRGLDAGQRRQLLKTARTAWRDATLLFISHDISETESFDRVIVIENGRIAESGNARQLMHDSSSRLYAMHQAERAVREGLWSDGRWRRLQLRDGELVEQ